MMCFKMNNNVIKVSIVILKTNDEQIKKCISYIKEQSMSDEIEIIILNNKDGKYPSASNGLNVGAGNARGNIIIFMHQDFYMEDNNLVLKYYNFLKKNNDSIIGPAGVKEEGLTITDITETNNKIRRGIRAYGKIMEVYSLDECMFAMSKHRWEMLKFDEITCDNWHCYAVDICYQNLVSGGKNILFPVQACHASTGNANTREFRRSVKKLLIKYINTPQIKKIKGTCIDISCNYPSYYFWIVKIHIKNFFKQFKLLFIEN